MNLATTRTTPLQAARTALMNAYRTNRQARPDDAYLPFPMDAMGLYRIVGPTGGRAPDPVDGFYVHDDFGQLVRLPLASVLQRFQ